jgi:hypothetical protein
VGTCHYQAGLDRNGRGVAYSISELADQFRGSAYFKRIGDDIASPWTLSWADAEQPLHGNIARKYRNSALQAIRLNLSRRLLIWRRDRRFLIANAIKNVIMGISVGGVFFQTSNIVSIFGVCFQINLFIMLGKTECCAKGLFTPQILTISLNQERWYLYQHRWTIA